MGTRHLIAVQLDGEYKIAQYGQWDGYPSGQGKTVIDFLSVPGNTAKLREALSKIRFLDAEGRDKEIIESYNANAPQWSNEQDKRTAEQRRWFRSYISRDLGAEILASVANSTDDEIILSNSIDFAGDSLMCEYAYVIDLDKNTLEVFKGFNHKPLDASERFFDAKTKDCSRVSSEPYYPVRLAKSYPLDVLPTVGQMEADVDPPEAEDAA